VKGSRAWKLRAGRGKRRCRVQVGGWCEAVRWRQAWESGRGPGAGARGQRGWREVGSSERSKWVRRRWWQPDHRSRAASTEERQLVEEPATVRPRERQRAGLCEGCLAGMARSSSVAASEGDWRCMDFQHQFEIKRPIKSPASEEGNQDGSTVRKQAEQAHLEAQRTAEARARQDGPVGGRERRKSWWKIHLRSSCQRWACRHKSSFWFSKSRHGWQQESGSAETSGKVSRRPGAWRLTSSKPQGWGRCAGPIFSWFGSSWTWWFFNLNWLNYNYWCVCPSQLLQIAVLPYVWETNSRSGWQEQSSRRRRRWIKM